MKYVSFLFAIALFAGVANASEKSVSFHYNNPNSYYSCSYAEGMMVNLLNEFGATEVSTNCTGGIQHDQLWPVSVDASFSHEEQGGRTVLIKGKESCDFNVKMIKAVLATVEHEVVKGSDSCWDAQGQYSYEVILK